MTDLRSEIKRILSEFEEKQICVNEAVNAILTKAKGTPYQVGDKVLILKDVSSHRFQIGEIVRLDSYDNPFWAATNHKNNYRAWLIESEFELYTEGK